MTDNRQDLFKRLAKKIDFVVKGLHAHRHYDFGRYQLGRQQIIILLFISEHQGSVSVKNLAKLLNVTPGAITQFIDSLENKKLVQRKTDTKDRRVILINLTETAKKELSKFRQDYLLTLSRAFGNMKTEEIEQLINLIGKIDISN